jgi:hypothetical protein
MDDSMFSLVFKGLQYLYGETSYQTQRNPIEIVVLYELIEIDAQKLKCDYKMLSEDEVFLDADDVVHVVRIVLLQITKDT